MHDIFISYSHQDKIAARLIAQRLLDEGLSVFFDSQGLVTGDNWNETLSRELEAADTVLVILSSNAARSKWVQSEIEQALAREKHIISILLDQHAKENWLWPLLGRRQSFELDIASKDIRDQLDHLTQTIRRSREFALTNMQSLVKAGTDSGRPAPSPMVETRVETWRIAALSSVTTILVSALMYWLLSK